MTVSTVFTKEKHLQVSMEAYIGLFMGLVLIVIGAILIINYFRRRNTEKEQEYDNVFLGIGVVLVLIAIIILIFAGLDLKAVLAVDRSTLLHDPKIKTPEKLLEEGTAKAKKLGLIKDENGTATTGTTGTTNQQNATTEPKVVLTTADYLKLLALAQANAQSQPQPQSQPVT